MANAKDTKTTDAPETVENSADTPVEATEAKKGRPTTRKPGGRTVSAYFDPDEYDALVEGSFDKRHRKDSDLIRAAVFAYIGYNPESAESAAE